MTDTTIRQVKNGIEFYRQFIVYGPFLLSSNRKCYFNCVSCKAGFHDMLNSEGKYRVHRNFFNLKEGEAAPVRKGDLIEGKRCPDCNKLGTLVKA